MPEARVDGAEQMHLKVDPIRWVLFILMLILALFIIVVGMVDRAAGLWDWKFVSIYSLWIIVISVFVCLNVYIKKTFVLYIFGYVASICTVFWFFCGVLKITAERLPLYIPICTDLGIFLGISISHFWSHSKEFIRREYYVTMAFIARTVRKFDPDRRVERAASSVGVGDMESGILLRTGTGGDPPQSDPPQEHANHMGHDT